jgi:hypothetical protein
MLLLLLLPLEFKPNFPTLKTFFRTVGGLVGTGGISDNLQGSFKCS